MSRPVLPLLLCVAMASPALAQGKRTVNAAVAANMKPAFEEISAAFQKANPGVEVSATYGASGTFLAQIANGAPFDLFLSADAEFPAKAVEKGFADGPAFPYAYGRLVVWVPGRSLPALEEKGLAALAAPSVQRIAIANPGIAPYGRAARMALERSGLLEAVKGKIVMGQNVSQAAQLVESGNAQAAILPLSLTRAPPLSGTGRAWAVPADLHDRVEQAGVVLKGARQPELARALAAFVRGDASRAILARYGYELPSR